MKVIIIGGAGFLGNSLSKLLIERGFEVVIGSRKDHITSKKNIKYIKWRIGYDRELLEEIQNDDYIIINLVGEDIAQYRWTNSRKTLLKESRIDTTKSLSIAVKNNPPKVFIQGSAIGFFGYKSTNPVDEKGALGSGFLATLTQQWEQALNIQNIETTRTIILRTGVVLDKNKGMLQRVLPIFKLGLGGRIGSGKQGFSWIHLSDWIHAVLFCINNETIRGVVNFTAPYPVSNQMFTKSLGRIIGRPTIIPVPHFFLRLVYGEMANELLIGGQYVIPAKLLNNGYKFKYENITQALNSIIKTDYNLKS